MYSIILKSTETERRGEGAEMFKNKCCDSAKLTDNFCGDCGTNLVLARERERKRRSEAELRKKLGICNHCHSTGQHRKYCTRCGQMTRYIDECSIISNFLSSYSEELKRKVWDKDEYFYQLSPRCR